MDRLSKILLEHFNSLAETEGVELTDDALNAAISTVKESVNTAAAALVEEAGAEDADEVTAFRVELACQLAGVDTEVELSVGQVIVVTDVLEDETLEVVVLEADGEDGDILNVPTSTIDTLLNDNAISYIDGDEIFTDEDEEVDESACDEGAKYAIRGGKKVKLSAKTVALRKKLAAKKGSGVNKYTIKDGKIVKKSAEQIAADKKKAKTFGKKMKRFAAKRNKSMKKARKLNDSVQYNVIEGFDLLDADTEDIIAVEAGDVLTVAEGNVVINSNGTSRTVGCDADFISTCLEEKVISLCEDDDDDDDDAETGDVVTYKGRHYKVESCKDGKCLLKDIDNGEEITVDRDELDGSVLNDSNSGDPDDKKGCNESVLTYSAGEGYVLSSQGSRRVLGNRLRTRAVLTNEGYTVTADSLEAAYNGKVVTL